MNEADLLYPFVNGLVFCGVGRRVTPFAPENDVRRHHYCSRTPAPIRAGGFEWVWMWTCERIQVKGESSREPQISEIRG